MMADRRRVIELFAEQPTSPYDWEEILERVKVSRWRLNRILKDLLNRHFLIAEIQGGTYPNRVKYRMSHASARKYAQLPAWNLGGSYDIDRILDEET